jgi:3-oxoacyl-[acyl-carrier protein] reductase
MTRESMKLENKIALVTGASRGIGRAIALRLADEGAQIAVHYNTRDDAAHEVANEIETRGGRAQIFAADLAKIKDVRDLVSQVETVFGPIELLINNAGRAQFGRLEKVSESDYDAMFSPNTKGVFFLTQAAAQKMPNGSRIILISSGITRANVAGGAAYAGSKAAIEAFARCWAAEFGPRQITVNVVSPGMTETDLLMESTPRHVLENFAAQTPLGRLGQPQDIADVVAFLCSDDARWLTAQNILANGGAA